MFRMTFVKKNTGLLRSVRSWGVLGLVLALAVVIQNAQTQVNPAGLITAPGGYVAASIPGGARILGDQGNLPTNPAIGFFSTCPPTPTVACNDGGGGNGIFRPLANVMAFATGSAERMRIGPGGWVAIGATTPAAGALLTVAGLAHVTGFQMPTGAGAGRVLTSNAAGVGTWLPPAPSGFTTLTIHSTPTSNADTLTATATAMCPVGRATGGGYDITGTIGPGGDTLDNFVVLSSAPSINAWMVTIRRSGTPPLGRSWGVVAHVVCAS